MDETTKQCTREVRTPLPTVPGHPARYDAEYERNGVGHLLIYYAPFDDWRRTDVATDHTASTWAEGVRRLVEPEDFPQAQRITLVLDNLSTHSGASLYKSFPPAKARALLDKLDVGVHAEARQLAEHGRVGVQRAGPAMPGPTDSRPSRRLREQVSAWTEQRNRTSKVVHWRFTAADARVKLHHLYPVIKD